MDKQKALQDIVNTWDINPLPTFRGFKCGNCQKYINEAYYHWLNSSQFYLPVHFCTSCQKLLKENKLEINISKGKHPKQDDFPILSESTKRTFADIVSRWSPHESNNPTPFFCDDCQGKLDNDRSDEMRKGYHVWWPNEGRLHELHFHRKCGDKVMGIGL